MERALSMGEIETTEDRVWPSFSETDLQLVVGADDLKSIERDILLFSQNSQKFQMIVTSPGPKLTGAIRFGAGNWLDLNLQKMAIKSSQKKQKFYFSEFFVCIFITR